MFKTLQKVILPRPQQISTLPLYVDAGESYGAQLSTMNKALGGGGGFATDVEDSKKSSASAVPVAAASPKVDASDVIGRRSTLVRAGSRISFATYFNAFPASYWKRWTTVEKVRLHIETTGSGTVIVNKSNARGALQQVETHIVSGETVLDIDLSLKPFGDGGWYWFDLMGGSEDLTLNYAEWQTAIEPEQQKTAGKITLEITTMNKVTYCLDNLRSLGSNPEALELLQEVLIVDQGTQKLQDHPDFEEVVAPLAGKFRLINQANLGGSGGFSRGMYEAVQNGSDYALLLDDDVVLEPESIIRLHTFAELCRKPTIVGAHMFDIYNRTVLHTFGEIVNTYRFQPDQPHEEQELGHDFQRANLRSVPWLHRRIDVDYNGWWMDLIPTQVIREIGLSLPIFIKWDDAEFGLRAKKAGFNTVSLPGAAVWHVSWIDKDDLVGWQAYFHIRNRIIASLIHSPYERGGRLLQESLQADVKHLLSMQYFTEQGRIMALRDVLAGPDQLHAIQPQRLPEIRALMKEYSDAQLKEDIDSFPEPKMSKPPRHAVRPPSYARLPLWAIMNIAWHLFKPVEHTSSEHPQAQIAHQDNRWWRTSKYDSVLVSNAEGTALSWYQRRPEQLRSKLAEATRLTAQLVCQWPKLSEQYRSAADRITSFQAWEETFAQYTESELKR